MSRWLYVCSNCESDNSRRNTMRKTVQSRLTVSVWTALYICCVVIPRVRAVPLSSFYPTDNSTVLPENDDGYSAAITLSPSFPFFGERETTAYVNNNGVVSFNESVSDYDATTFPINGSAMLTPYWGDVDTRGTGEVLYRQTSDSALLSMARDDVLMVYSNFTFFNPTSLLIATWDHVGHFENGTNLTNTFQCILITDGTNSFVIFLYADNLIQWSFGDASRVDAQAGFNAGDGERHFTISGSQTPAIVNITTTSNIGVPGKYLFRVDDATIATPPPPPTNMSPQITTSPGDTVSLRGESPQFTCTASGLPLPSISWLRNGSALSTGAKYSITSTSNDSLVTSTLTVVNLTLTDTGAFTCSASNSEGTVSSSYTLTVEGAPEFPSGPSETLTFGHGTSVSIVFVLEAFPAPTNITLMKNSTSVPTISTTQTDSITTVVDLEVTTLQFSDAGIYTLQATNTRGSGTKEITLIITPPPGIVSSPMDEVIIIVNSTLTVYCAANTTATITWSAGSEELLNGGRYSMSSESDSSFLTISNAVEGDSGTYSCTAAVGSGTPVSASFELTVLPIPSIVFVSEPSSSILAVNEVVQFRCAAYVSVLYSVMTLTWSDENSGTTPSENDGFSFYNETLEASGILFVTSVLSFSGSTQLVTYNLSCTANVLGIPLVHKPFFLSVTTETVVIIINGPTEVGVESTLTVTCEAEATNPDIVYFVRNGVVITSDSRVTVTAYVGHSTLTVHSVEQVDAGLYSCIMNSGSDGGTASAELNITVREELPYIESFSLFVDGVESNETAVLSGSSITLTCNAFGIPEPELMWEKDGQLLNNSSITHVSSQVYSSVLTLTIGSVVSEDGGEYACVATNRGGTDRDSRQLQVLVLPHIVSSPDDVEVESGTNISPTCTAEGTSLSDITWRKEDSVLVDNPHLTIITHALNNLTLTSNLFVSSIELEDTGNYSCTASSVVGNDTRTFTLFVIERPLVTGIRFSTESELELVLGDDVEIECTVTGVPAPSITWEKDGIDLSSIPKLIIYHTTLPNNSVLSVLFIGYTDIQDNGEYVCSATNQLGNSSLTIELSLLVPTAFESIPPNSEVVVTSSVSLSCSASGVPLPSITWSRVGYGGLANGTDYVIISAANNSTQHVTSVLTIVSAVQGDTGLYSCTAENSVSTVCTIFHLQVQEPPAVTEVAFSVGPEVVVGETAELQCTAFGVPAPNISWQAGGSVLMSGGRINITEGGSTGNTSSSTLRVSSVALSDDGQITCVADNGVVSPVTSSLNLTVLFPPTLTASSESVVEVVMGTSVTLTCSASGLHLPNITWTIPDPENERVIISQSTIDEIFTSQLDISNTEQADTGNYSCTAENSVGSDTDYIFLQVLEPPAITEVAFSVGPEVVVGETAELWCTAFGVPAPNISWQAGGSVLMSGGRINITEGGSTGNTSSSTLRVSSVALSDDGQITCVADNGVVSPVTSSLNLTVLFPPTLTASSESVVEVVMGTSVTLTCSASGLHLPNITWTIPDPENERVIISQNTIGEIFITSQLDISNTERADTGNYSCTAENSVGSDTDYIFLQVLEPPAITEVAFSVGPEVVVGETAELQCTAFGVPAPNISWQAGGSVLMSGGRINITEGGSTGNTSSSTLRVSSVALSDDGQITCVADNGVVSPVTSSLNLTVLFPPTLTASSESVVEVVMGTSVTLTCSASGLHLPNITWTIPDPENEQVIISQSTIGESFITSQLDISNTEQADTGNYSCTAENSVGSDTGYIFLQVLEPPAITEVAFSVGPEVVVGETAELWCTAFGVPAPNISWQAGGSVLMSGGRINITEGGSTGNTSSSTLRVSSVALSDDGQITCVADNGVVSPVTSSLNLTVLFPPTLTASSESVVEVVMGTSVTLTCSASGLHLPNITWTIPDPENERIIISQNTIGESFITSQLDISNTEQADTGNYSCTAENSVGSDTGYIFLQVLEPPAITEVAFSVGPEVVVGETAELQCTAFGVPAPNISWQAGGSVLMSGGRINITEGGSTGNTSSSTLRVSSVALSDDGQITCVADNGVVSPVTSSLNLTVLLPPTLTASSESVVEVVMGTSVTLTCSASGLHLPNITWTIPDPENERVIISQSTIDESFITSQLDISNTEQADTGNYSCTAENSVGSDTGYIFLQVLEPPAITEVAFSVGPEVVVGETAELQCTAFGVPAPNISWQAGGSVLMSGGRINITEGGSTGNTSSSTLRVSSVALSDDGQITCVADNGVVSPVTSSLNLTVLLPPTLTASSESVVEVVMGTSVTLTCSASGVHLPNITWTIPDPENERVIISQNTIGESFITSQLDISNTEQADTGNYSCTAENSVGSDTGYIFLQVLEPPAMTEVAFSVGPEVVVGETAELQCTAFGVPAPNISWQAGGSVLMSGGRINITEGGSTGNTSSSTLRVSSVALSDDGQITCVADNGVVSAVTSSLNLTVLFPPTLTASSESVVEVVMGTSVTLTCSASGLHLPNITWTIPDPENERVIISQSTIGEIFITSQLDISNTEQADTGNYSCTAENSVGSDTGYIFLQVLEPPAITEVAFSVGPEVVVGETAELQCTAFGVPAPNISWQAGGSVLMSGGRINITEGGSTGNTSSSTLRVSSVALSDDGQITCVADNGVVSPVTSSLNLTVLFPPTLTASSESVVEVVMGTSVTLTCSASGLHLPNITWTIPDPENEQVIISQSTIGESFITSQLDISNTEQADTGNYSCTAENSVGSDTDYIFLQVLEPPAITEVAFSVGPEVVVGETAELQCTAFGVPAPNISWQAGGSVLMSGGRINITGGGSTGNTSSSTLRVSSVALSDDGQITCVADNGVVSPVTSSLNLTVLFPPTLTASSESVVEVVMGTSVTLTCSASGLHLPNITWTIPDPENERVIISQSTIGESFITSQLDISNTEQADTGNYSCTAENSVGSDTSYIFLQVLEPAEVVSHTEDTEVIIADRVTVYCKATGIYRPIITWLRDSEIVQNSSRVTISESISANGGVNSTLTIHAFTRSDAGEYSCTATNSAGNDDISFELIIQEPALVVVYPDDVQLLAGDSVLLTCIGYGVPPPSVGWQKNGESLTNNSTKFTLTEANVFIENTTLFVKSTLLLCNASELDIREYSCTADNAIRNTSSENFSVAVQTIPPVILAYPEDASATTHSTVSLVCAAFGAPSPSVTWNWNGSEVSTSGSDYRVENKLVKVRELYLSQSVLHVCGFSLLTAGNYSCSAENYAAETSATTELSLEVPASVAVAPNDTSVFVGESLALSCVVYGLPLPTVTWMRNGQRLRPPFLLNETEIETRHVTLVRSILHFCSLQLGDDDQYACIASNNFSTAAETFTLSIKVDPQIVIYPNNSEFLAGSTLLLSCTAYGIPLPSIVWSKGSINLQTVVVNDSRVEVWDETVVVKGHMLRRSYLQLCGMIELDSGIYSCSAVTSERQNRVEFGVTVVGVPPTLIRTPEDIDIVAEMGDSVVASCTAYGSPVPEISWSLLQNSSTTQATSSVNTTVTTTSGSSICTNQFVKNGVGVVYSSLLLCPNHPGALTTSLVSCSASNGVDGGNMTSHTFLVNVTAEPVVLDSAADYRGFVRETFSLVCTADGVPLPDITWLKYGCPITRHIEQSSRFQITERVVPGFREHVPEAKESVLTIEDSTEHDAGTYSCRATNTLNTAYLPVAHQITVDVVPVTVDICSTITLCENGGTCMSRGNSYSCMCPDGWIGTQCDQEEILLSPPVLLKSPQTTFAQHLVEVVFDCDVTGNPEPVITWYRDGMEIIGATQKMLDIAEVDLMDRAAYHCTAENSLGNVTSEEAYLSIRGLGQFLFSVSTGEDDLSALDKWFDVHVEETDISTGSGAMATVLCIEPFNQTLEGDWTVFITLQSVDGEDLKLAQVTEGASNLFRRVREELGVEVYLDEISRFDGCPENVTTVASNSCSDLDLHLLWSDQPFGGLAVISCPCDAVPLPLMATRRCAGSFGGVVDWAEPDDSQCDFSDTTRILCTLPDTEQLAALTNPPDELSTLEVYLGAVNVELAANETSGNAFTSDNVLTTIDHLLSAPIDVLQSSQEEFNSSSMILESLNEVLDSYPLPDTPPLLLLQDTFTAFIDFNFNSDTFTGSSAAFSTGNSSGLGPTEDDDNPSISLSSDLASILGSQEDSRIVFTMYTTEGLFLEREEFISDSNRTNLVLGSVVLAARLSQGVTVSGIENVVTLTFTKNEVAMVNGSISICVFWNQTLDEGYGGWSEEGCRLVLENELMAVCTCNHLTSFGLIVDTSPREELPSDDRGIGPYIYVGGLFSAVFLLLTIMTYLCTKYQRSSVTGVLLLNACAAHLLLNLCFIGSYYGRFSERRCYGLSVMLHYLFLVTALSLACLALTKFMRTGSRKNNQRNRVEKFTIISGVSITWFFPAVIVALSVGFSHTYSNNDAFCRPVEGSFHYGLVLPWALGHLAVYLGLFFLPCPCFSNTLREHVRRSWLREYTGIFLTLVLFDIGWGLGLPAMHPLHVGSLRFYGQIVFSATNGCVGLVLFVFFCIMSETVRQTCIITVILKSFRQRSIDWQRKSGLYKGDDDDSKEMVEAATIEEEEIPVITFEYDLNEVYGNPAVVTAEEEYAFESETQFK